MIYDYYKEQNKRGIGKKLAVVLAVIVFIWLLIQSAGIYLKVI